MEPNRFEPNASDSEEEGGSVREDENAGHMITSARWGLIFCSIDGLHGRDFVLIDKLVYILLEQKYPSSPDSTGATQTDSDTVDKMGDKRFVPSQADQVYCLLHT